MKPDFTARSFLLWFGVVLLLYLGFFHGIERWRRQQGPWVVEFLADHQGQPCLAISQEKLHIRQLRITLAGETVPGPVQTSLPRRVVFDQPRRPLPFGKRLHEDLTSLPGVVTLDLFGHFVELAPKVMTLNRERQPWPVETNLTLWPTNKLPQPLRPSEAIEDPAPVQGP